MTPLRDLEAYHVVVHREADGDVAFADNTSDDFCEHSRDWMDSCAECGREAE